MSSSSRTARVFLLLLLFFVVGRCLVPTAEADLFLTLRLGEVILDQHVVPSTNTLAFTYPDAPAADLGWLFQVVVALTHRAAGITGVILLKTLLVALSFGLLFRAALRRGARPVVTAVALASVVWAAAPRLTERPDLVTFLGLSGMALLLARWEQGLRPRIGGVAAAALLWSNLDPHYYVAPVMLTLYAGGYWLDERAGRVSDERRGTARPLGVAAGIGALLVLATPAHVRALPAIVAELSWGGLRDLAPFRAAAWPVAAPVAGIVAALIVGLLAARRHPTTRQALPVVAAILVGWRYVRFTGELAIWASPLLAVAWSTAMERVTRGLARAPHVARILNARPQPGASLVAVALLVATIVPRYLDVREERAVLDLGVRQGFLPLGAINFMKLAKIDDHVYNDLDAGPFLAWLSWPEHRVFQDPRVGAYPRDFHDAMARPDPTPAEWETLMQRYGVEAALVSTPHKNPRVLAFSPATWAPVYRGGDGLVFVRRTPEHRAWLSRWELPVTFEYRPDAGVLVKLISERPSDSPVRPCEWERRRGEVLFEVGQYRDALRAFRTALAYGMDCIEPAERQALTITVSGLQMRMSGPADAVDLLQGLPDPVSRTNRGFALLRLARLGEALQDFEGALTIDPANLEAQFGRALSLQLLGNAGEAIAAFKKYLALAPEEHPTRKDAQTRLDVLLGKIPPPPPGPGQPPGAPPSSPEETPGAPAQGP